MPNVLASQIVKFYLFIEIHSPFSNKHYDILGQGSSWEGHL